MNQTTGTDRKIILFLFIAASLTVTADFCISVFTDYFSNSGRQILSWNFRSKIEVRNHIFWYLCNNAWFHRDIFII